MAEERLCWTCSCGKFQVKLTGDPQMSMVCHCHSCVAPSRFIDEKRGHGGPAGSALKDHGAAASYFKASQVEFPSDKDLETNLSFVKVGDKGRAGRAYTNCCQTQLSNLLAPKFVGLTTNFIRNGDNTPFVPSGGPVLNVNATSAFDVTLVPDPKHNTAPIGTIAKFVYLLFNPFETSLAKTHPALFPDPSKAETVPITW